MLNIKHSSHQQAPTSADPNLESHNDCVSIERNPQIQELIRNTLFQDLIHDLILGKLRLTRRYTS